MRYAAIRAAVAALLSIWLLVFALTIYLHMQWSYAMPKRPDPASGRTHRLVVNHGWVIFVTDGEARFFSLVTIQGFMLGTVGLFTAVGLRRKYLLPRA